jgi:hypothetical protein
MGGPKEVPSHTLNIISPIQPYEEWNDIIFISSRIMEPILIDIGMFDGRLNNLAAKLGL